MVDVNYDGKTFPVYINVGRAINDGSYHIYDITEKVRDTASRINGLERPKPNEGYALKNDVSTNIIPDSTGKSNSISEKSAKDSGDVRKNFVIEDTVNEASLTVTQREDVKILRRVAEFVPGIDFVITNKGVDADGNYNALDNGVYSDGEKTVYVDISAGRKAVDSAVDFGVALAGSHEVVHAIKANAPAYYSELQSYVLETYYPTKTLDYVVKMRMEEYQKRENELAKAEDREPREITYDYALEEVMANSLEGMLRSERVMFKLAKGHRRLFSRIWQYIRDFFNRVIRKIGQYSGRTVESRILSETQKSQRKLEDLFVKALRAASDGAAATRNESASSQTTENNEKTTVTNTNEDSVNVSDGLKQSLKSDESSVLNYQKLLDSWDGQTEGFSFVIGDTPAYFSNLEVKGRKIGKRQVRIDATKVKKIINEHPEMTVQVIKELPKLLNDPIVVLDSKTVEGRLVLLGEVYVDEKPVMMVLEINPTTRSGNSTYANIVKVASAYTRSNTQNLINTSNIRFICKNKNRVSDWLKVNRLQLPLPNSQSNSATNSILDSAEKSNTISENSSENSGNKKFSHKDTEGREALIEAFSLLAKTDSEKLVIDKYRRELSNIEAKIEERAGLQGKAR